MKLASLWEGSPGFEEPSSSEGGREVTEEKRQHHSFQKLHCKLRPYSSTYMYLQLQGYYNALSVYVHHVCSTVYLEERGGLIMALW